MMLQLMTGFCSLLVGRIIYRFRAKFVITSGALLLGFGFALLSLMHELWQFYLLYAIIGLGSAGAGIVPTSTIVCNWFKRRQGFAMAILGTGIGVGGLVIPVLLGMFVIPQFGWRMGFAVSGIVLVGVLIPLTLWFVKSRPEEMGLLPDDEEIEEGKNHQDSDATDLRFKLSAVLKTRLFWLMAGAFAIFGMANGQTFQNQVPHLQDVGFSAAIAVSTLSFVGIGSAIGKFTFGWLCDYISPKYILPIGSALQAVATLILMSVTTNSPTSILWVYAFMFGLGMGSWFPAISMTINMAFGPAAYGHVFGIYFMFFVTGSAIAPWVGGYIFDATGSYYLAFLLCLGLYAIVVPCMLLVRRPKTRNN